MHSFTWLSKWVNLLQHLVQSLCYFGHTILVWLLFKPFYCCFSKIKNKKLPISQLICPPYLRPNGKWDLETVWTISRWWFNLHDHWYKHHSCVLFWYMFSAVICFARGASISVPTNSSKLAKSGNIPKCFMYINYLKRRWHINSNIVVRETEYKWKMEDSRNLQLIQQMLARDCCIHIYIYTLQNNHTLKI
jgi:hypothetical protein